MLSISLDAETKELTISCRRCNSLLKSIRSAQIVYDSPILAQSVALLEESQATLQEECGYSGDMALILIGKLIPLVLFVSDQHWLIARITSSIVWCNSFGCEWGDLCTGCTIRRPRRSCSVDGRWSNIVSL